MKKILYFAPLMMLPVVTFAAPQDDVKTIIGFVGGWVDLLIPIVIGFAFIYFVWGLTKYITAEGDEKRSEGRSIMIQGIIAMFVIVSIWGLVDFLGNLLGVTSGGSANLPTL